MKGQGPEAGCPPVPAWLPSAHGCWKGFFLSAQGRSSGLVLTKKKSGYPWISCLKRAGGGKLGSRETISFPPPSIRATNLNLPKVMERWAGRARERGSASSSHPLAAPPALTSSESQNQAPRSPPPPHHPAANPSLLSQLLSPGHSG